MFSIGDFARHGRVSVRMLRHYDALGLLRPAHVDPVSGYRFYEAGQLSRLNRIIALKDLGFTLGQVQTILHGQLGAEELESMLRVRREELAAAVAEATARLGQVEARLRIIASEGLMSSTDVVVKAVPAVRVAELSAVAAGFRPEEIGPVVGPLFERLDELFAKAGVTPAGPGIAYYEDCADGEGIRCHAAMAVGPGVTQIAGLELVDLPPLARAATAVHHGPPSRIVTTAQVLAHWIADNGHRSGGYAREVYLECPPDQEKWVTEIQEPLV
ncbi:MerR family transcriptional regulator [Streptomyces sp. NA04227]|uniref:MerR family transcriptional regulator n=1 Tax=Streptomyces sp. NA04227 TaxID=2742136 RepID=UPI001591869C|nr:MerR family transcriptional regulator [Streptomyces sp. NA04227]QKW09913.1 MerR family transcriptional regulator [Streptomyces sp. NA04227]